MSEHSDDKVWLTTSEAQTYLQISKTTLYECMKDGRLPYYYVKGTRQRRIKKDDLDDLMTLGDSENDAE
ncbi:MAG: helix-turn-helix domain-containing protein [Ardenticatenaceae bacterium]|nr:helix-turn-helix domain-containing protein [Ardenticatenaceae bacterium]